MMMMMLMIMMMDSGLTMSTHYGHFHHYCILFLFTCMDGWIDGWLDGSMDGSMVRVVGRGNDSGRL